jgi:Uri superfamily endonuclease
MPTENKKAVPAALAGVYVLVIQVNKDKRVNVGALGKLTFKKGLYAYVGSAQNNLKQRVKRHLRKEKRRFWHVDYLLDCDATEVVKVFHKRADKTEECAIAKAIGQRGEPINGFGSSDCNCRSHLFRIRDYEYLRESMQILDVKTQASQEITVKNSSHFSYNLQIASQRSRNNPNTEKIAL